VTKSPDQEPFKGYAARKIGEALVLLSLDSLAPFFPLVQVGGVPNAGQFQKCIREFITRNRAKGPQEAQDLFLETSIYIEKNIGTGIKNQFQYWYQYVYVHSAEDYREFGSWGDIFLNLFRGRLIVDQSFGLPQRISETARQKALSELPLADFYSIDEKHENDELSAWDVEMYARHGLYDEMRDPLIPMQLTFTQLRYRQFVGWLTTQLNFGELSAFQDKVHAALKNDPKFCEAYDIAETLPDLMTQVLPNAENIQ
jgi:hypothetical protein